jgi:carbamate kinase
MVKQGFDVVVTHGNGPQVGNTLLRVEASKDIVPPLSLDLCGAQTQAELGYMIQQTLGNELRATGVNRVVTTVVTQVVVDSRDRSFHRPSKPIGPFYREKIKGWHMIEDAGRGYRRVVPSPMPKEIVEAGVIRRLLEDGFVVVAAGGGGIPVVRDKKGNLRGVAAVVDKDHASSLLSTTLGAELFLISTDVDRVYLNYNRPGQMGLDHLEVGEVKRYLAEGHFLKGSMEPKMRAVIDFIENGGERAIVTSPELIPKALKGKAGTTVSKRRSQ